MAHIAFSDALSPKLIAEKRLGDSISPRFLRANAALPNASRTNCSLLWSFKSLDVSISLSFVRRRLLSKGPISVLHSARRKPATMVSRRKIVLPELLKRTGELSISSAIAWMSVSFSSSTANAQDRSNFSWSTGASLSWMGCERKYASRSLPLVECPRTSERSARRSRLSWSPIPSSSALHCGELWSTSSLSAGACFRPKIPPLIMCFDPAPCGGLCKGLNISPMECPVGLLFDTSETLHQLPLFSASEGSCACGVSVSFVIEFFGEEEASASSGRMSSAFTSATVSSSGEGSGTFSCVVGTCDS